MHFLSLIKKKSNPTTKEIEMKFIKLSDDLNIKLIKGAEKRIFHAQKNLLATENISKQSLLTQILKANA